MVFLVERYLSQDFTDELLADLATELTPLTCEGFLRGSITPELQADVVAHLKVADRIVVVRGTHQEPIAFITASMHLFNSDAGEALMYHLEGIIVKTEYQGSGLSKALLAEDVKHSEATYLGFHTQNARMKALGAKIAYISEECSCNYGHVINTRNQSGNVDVNRYGNSSLYGDASTFSTIAVNGINWQNGDAIICIGPIRQEILR